MLFQPNHCSEYRGHGQGLGAERRVQCIFHASLTHHNRGLVLAGTNGTIHPHRVPRGMPTGILPNQKRPRKQSSSLSCTRRVIWGDLWRGTEEENWRMEPESGPHWDIPLSACQNRPPFSLSLRKMSPFDPDNCPPQQQKKQEMVV